MPNAGHTPRERILSALDINNLIELLIGDDTPLRAVEYNSEVYLLDEGENANENTKLIAEDVTRDGILKLLYDYAVHFGYTNEDFGDFVGA